MKRDIFVFVAFHEGEFRGVYADMASAENSLRVNYGIKCFQPHENMSGLEVASFYKEGPDNWRIERRLAKRVSPDGTVPRS